MAIRGPKNFTPEELQELKKLQENLNTLSFQFGQLQISKIKLQEQEDFLKNQLLSLNKEETEIAKRLTDKYGKGNLDLETGEFAPIE
jgi:hypothetical protein|tara:strand:+ start:2012 stop:2272 length:261 start_codon:yes stop_codon:yes gene_type:complete